MEFNEEKALLLAEAEKSVVRVATEASNGPVSEMSGTLNGTTEDTLATLVGKALPLLSKDAISHMFLTSQMGGILGLSTTNQEVTFSDDDKAPLAKRFKQAEQSEANSQLSAADGSPSSCFEPTSSSMNAADPLSRSQSASLNHTPPDNSLQLQIIPNMAQPLDFMNCRPAAMLFLVPFPPINFKLSVPRMPKEPTMVAVVDPNSSLLCNPKYTMGQQQLPPELRRMTPPLVFYTDFLEWLAGGSSDCSKKYCNLDMVSLTLLNDWIVEYESQNIPKRIGVKASEVRGFKDCRYNLYKELINLGTQEFSIEKMERIIYIYKLNKVVQENISFREKQ